MEAVILGISTMSIVSAASTNLLVGVLTGTAGSVCGYVKHISSYDQPGAEEVARELATIDLEFTVSVIQQLVKEHNKKEANESVKNALYGVNDILEKIDDELKIIKDAMENHKTKYFNSWRSFDCKCNIENIKHHKNILDKRSRMLMDLLKIYKE